MKIYFPNLNGLRFIAALIVMSYHFYGETVIHGHYGVVLFFVLSGFLITFLLFEEKEKFKKIKVLNFYMRRVLRIWPLYFLILSISISLYYYFNNDFNTINQILLYTFFLPNVAFALNLTISSYASILWSIGSEEQFYLFWPMLIVFFQKRNFLLLNLFFILFFTFGPNIIDFINHNFFSNYTIITQLSKIFNRTGFNCIATGAVFAYFLRFKKEILIIFHKKEIQILNFILITIFLVFDSKNHFFKGINDQIFAILFGILISNLATNKNSIINLENKILNFLGKISFGIYMYHLLLIDFTLFMTQNFEINKHILFLISLMLTILISYISFNYFEKQFLRIKNNKFSYKS